MAEIHVQRTIAAPTEQVFDWLADPANLVTAPLVLKSAWAKDSPAPGAGAVREVLGAGMWFREEIPVYERPAKYTYLIVRSFPAFNHDGGTLTFTPVGTPAKEGTRVEWDSSYTHPLHAGGRAMQALSRPLLAMNFRAILDACARALEK